MKLSLATAPAAEPILLANATNHLKVDGSADDTLINRLIKTARERAEGITRRAFITQTWDLFLDAWPGRKIVLPKPPVKSITGIYYTPDGGSETEFDSANYLLDQYSEPAVIVLKSTKNWPSDTLVEVNGIRVRFVAGYGASGDSIPEIYRQAMYLIIGHWYENREAILTSGAVPKEIPMGAEDLLLMDRGVYKF